MISDLVEALLTALRHLIDQGKSYGGPVVLRLHKIYFGMSSTWPTSFDDFTAGNLIYLVCLGSCSLVVLGYINKET